MNKVLDEYDKRMLANDFIDQVAELKRRFPDHVPDIEDALMNFNQEVEEGIAEVVKDIHEDYPFELVVNNGTTDTRLID